jgi:DNA polymerase-3 subunit epsilon
MRQIVLDTETTGLSPQQGHRIIEIGCVELIHRRPTGKEFHTYLQPNRPIDAGATQVHGITNAFLKGKPKFQEVAQQFKEFIAGAELIIHNASFDVNFIENEFNLMEDHQWKVLDRHCQITCTLQMARRKHPGQKNNLDALCKRYNVNADHRDKHGALLDAQILSHVYIAMTGGQNALVLDENAPQEQAVTAPIVPVAQFSSPVIYANAEELSAHEMFLATIEAKQGSGK